MAINLTAIPKQCADNAVKRMEAGNVYIGEFGQGIIEIAIVEAFKKAAALIDDDHQRCPDPQACCCESIADAFERLALKE